MSDPRSAVFFQELLGKVLEFFRVTKMMDESKGVLLAQSQAKETGHRLCESVSPFCSKTDFSS